MKKILVLLLVAIMLSTVIYGYMVSQVKTNDVTFNIGTPDGVTATLETDLLNKVLIPYNSTPTNSNEVTEYRFYLRVVYSESVYFTISDNLPSEYEVIYDSTSFLTNNNYMIIIRLIKEVSYTSQTFNLVINF